MQISHATQHGARSCRQMGGRTPFYLLEWIQVERPSNIKSQASSRKSNHKQETTYIMPPASMVWTDRPNHVKTKHCTDVDHVLLVFSHVCDANPRHTFVYCNACALQCGGRPPIQEQHAHMCVLLSISRTQNDYNNNNNNKHAYL